MYFDKELFGHDRFVIKDNHLLRGTSHTVANRKEVKLHKVSKTNSNNTLSCLVYTEYIEWLEQDAANCTCSDPNKCDWFLGCSACSNTLSATLTYGVGDCGGGGTGGDATWSPYPPPGAGGSGPITSSSGGWAPYPDTQEYQDFVNNSLNQSQQTFWNNPSKSGFISPLIHLLVKGNYSPDAQSQVIYWLNYVMNSTIITPEKFVNYFMSDPEGSDGYYDASYWDDPSLYIPPAPLPAYSAFKSAFPKNIGSDGKPIPMSNTEVYDLVGGTMKQKHHDGNIYYTNACAIRGSRALNYCGHPIPNTVQGTEVGDDGKRYILSAKAFNKYMRKKYGPATHRLTAAEINGNPDVILNFLLGKTGIYTLVTKGGPFSGHVDIIEFGNCLSGAAISNIANIDYIEIWELP